jgi:hypothetical protein
MSISPRLVAAIAETPLLSGRVPGAIMVPKAYAPGKRAWLCGVEPTAGGGGGTGEDDVNDISVALEMPIELGRIVVSSPVVRASLDNNPDARVRSQAAARDAGGAYRDFGATALLVLGTPSAVAAVTSLFAVIRTAIKEAHKTLRERQGQDYEMRKLVLILGAKREEIDLAKDLQEIETRVDELEHEAAEQLSP